MIAGRLVVRTPGMARSPARVEADRDDSRSDRDLKQLENRDILKPVDSSRPGGTSLPRPSPLRPTLLMTRLNGPRRPRAGGWRPSAWPPDGAGADLMRSPRLTAWLIAATAMVCRRTPILPPPARRTSISTATSGPSSPRRATSATARTHNKRKADLRLDTRAGLFRSADGSTVVVPGKPDESELLAPDHRRGRRDPHAAAQGRQAADARPGRPRSADGSSRGPSGRGTGPSSRPRRPAVSGNPRRRRPDRPVRSAPGWRPRGSSPPPRPIGRR